MKKLLSLLTALPLVAILMFSPLVFADTGNIVVEGKPVTGKIEVGGGTLELPNSNTLPGTCAVGDTYILTDAASGQQCYICESANVWTPQGSFYGAAYFSDYNEADQGATGDGKSTKAYIDTISINSATLIFQHNSGAATTTYTFSTSETIPSNINIIIEKGAILSIDNTFTLTINGPFDAELYQVFSGAGNIVFGSGSIEGIYPQWFGAIANDNTKDAINTAAINSSIQAIDAINGEVIISIGTFYIDSGISLPEGITISGVSKMGSILQRTGTGGYVVGVEDISEAKVSIQNLSLISGTVGVHSDYSIYLKNTAQIEISSVRTSTSAISGIELTGTVGNYCLCINITDSFIQNGYGDGIRSSGVNNINQINIIGNRIQANAGYGINATVVGYAWNVSGNDIEGNGAANQIIWSGGGGGCSFTGNYSEPGGAGAAWNFSKIDGLSIHGNNISAGGSGDPAILLGPTSVSNVNISGNILHSTDVGIEITGASVSSRSQFTANKLVGTTNHLLVDSVYYTETTITRGDSIVQIGSAEKFTIVGGVSYVNITPVGTDAGVAEKTLMSYTEPAFALDANTKGIRITVWGYTGANANTKRIKLKYGGGAFIADTGAIAANATPWRIVAEVIRTATNAQICYSTTNVNGILTGVVKRTVGAENYHLSTDIFITGQNGAAVANDIIAEGMIVETIN